MQNKQKRNKIFLTIKSSHIFVVNSKCFYCEIEYNRKSDLAIELIVLMLL